MRLLLLVWAVGLCSGCLTTRKFLIQEDYLNAPTPQGELVQVEFETGWRHEPSQRWTPRVVDQKHLTLQSPAEITSAGWLAVRPLVRNATLSLWIRHAGWNEGGFTQVKAVTGAIEGSLANEVRFVPGELEETFVLPVHQLHNVYNDFAFRDGDLLMVEVDAPGSRLERYVFRSTEFGWRTKFSAGILVRTPLPLIGAEHGEVSPAFAITAAFGYRYRTRDSFVAWLGRRVSLVTSLGVGSTNIVVPGQNTGLEDNLRGVFNATLVGGGLEFYDIVSLQVLVNLTSLGRDKLESISTLAVGLDAVQFGRFTADAGARLFRKNTLDGPDDPTVAGLGLGATLPPADTSFGSEAPRCDEFLAGPRHLVEIPVEAFVPQAACEARYCYDLESGAPVEVELTGCAAQNEPAILQAISRERIRAPQPGWGWQGEVEVVPSVEKPTVLHEVSREPAPSSPVSVHVRVDEEGRVVRATIHDRTQDLPSPVNALLEAAERWRFEPLLVGETPQGFTTVIQVR